MTGHRNDHGSHTEPDAAWAEHQRALDDHTDDRPTRIELELDERGATR